MANTQVSSLLGSIPFLRPYLTLRSYDVVMVVPDGAQLESVLGHVAAGRIRAVIDQNFSLPKAAEASLHLYNCVVSTYSRSSRSSIIEDLTAMLLNNHLQYVSCP